MTEPLQPEGRLYRFPAVFMLFFLLSGLCIAGQANTDSLEKVAASGKPEEQFKAFKALSKHYQRRDPEKSVYYAEKQRDIADALNKPGMYAEAIADLSVPHTLMNHNKESIRLLQESVRIFDSLKDERGKAMALNNLGIVWSQQGSMEKALENYMKVIDYYERRGEKKSLARVYLNIGLVYENKGKYDLAIDVTRKARNIFQAEGDQEMVASTLVNLGLYHTATGKFSEARVFLDQAWLYYNKTGNTYGRAITLTNTGRLLQKQAKYSEAREYLRNALPFIREIRNQWAEASVYHDLAEISFAEQQWKQSLIYLHQAKQLLGKEPEPDLDSKIHLTLSRTYNRLEQKDSAFDAFQRYVSIRDTMFTRQKEKIVEELSVSFEAAQKETAMQILKKDYQAALLRQWMILGFAASLFLVALLIIRMQVMKRRHAEKERQHERQRQEAELEEIRTEQQIHEEALEKMALEIQIKEKELVYQTLLRLDMKHVNQNIQDKLTPFRYRLSTKKDQQEFAKALQEISLETDQEPMADFEVLFRQLHKGFEDKLLAINPGFSRSELTVCALLRINLTSKDIARLLNLSASSVDMTRYRIRQKLGLDQGENLTRYLISL